MEINSTSVDRAIALVGKQIVGVLSGATAFVERYVKIKVNTGFVHVLYVTNVSGTFQVNEKLKYNQIFNDAPRVLGSFVEADVLVGSEFFNVGDFVNFESDSGLGAVGRVTQTVKGTGEVSFNVIDKGWGYATNRKIDNTAPVTSNTLLSERTLLLANVVPRLYLSSLEPSAARGLGYNNTDIVTIGSIYKNAKAVPITDGSGSVISYKVTDQGGGFIEGQSIDSVFSIASSTGNGGLSPPTAKFSYPDSYFEFIETIKQPLYNIVYNDAAGLDQITTGLEIKIVIVQGPDGQGNARPDILKFGRIVDINKVANTAVISMLNRDFINVDDTLISIADPNVYINPGIVTLAEAEGRVIGVINEGTMVLDPPSPNDYAEGDVIFQQDEDGNILASALITSTSQLAKFGFISVSNIAGVFRIKDKKLKVLNRPAAQSNCASISLSIAIDTSNTFIDTFTPNVYTPRSGTSAQVLTTTAGRDADYRIATLDNKDIVRVNTDNLTDDILNTRLDADGFNLPFNPSANISNIIYGALTYENATIGSIKTLGDINPGTGYNKDPTAVAYQPYVAGDKARDYIFTVSDNETSFNIGEIITQNNVVNTATLFVASTAPFRIGEFVHVANNTVNFIANGIVQSANVSNSFIVMEHIDGTIPSAFANHKLMSLATTGNSAISSATSNTAVVVAKGIVKDSIGNKVFVKRIQLKNMFTANTIAGGLSGTAANVALIEEDYDSLPAGFNSNIRARASTSDGVISRLQVVDSGFGYLNDTELVFRSSTDDRTGMVAVGKGGVGVGTGYYTTTKGFLSDISSIHDGDYYQEYSYDIISRIPLDKYSSMFKKVMHTAGTRYFGTLLIESFAPNAGITYANTTIEITPDSPLTIEDRASIDIQDIQDINIEIRE
jgi:hypothetical protein